MSDKQKILFYSHFHTYLHFAFLKSHRLRAQPQHKKTRPVQFVIEIAENSIDSGFSYKERPICIIIFILQHQ